MDDPHDTSAVDVRDALADRIARGIYPRGSPLPPVRELAAEFGVSPSTVSRALQLLARQGQVDLRPRRRAVSLGPGGGRDPRLEVQAALRRLAFRWRLWGRDREELLALVRQVLDDAFRPSRRAVFVECNQPDLDRMAEEVRLATGIQVTPMLIQELAVDPRRATESVVLTPYYHLAEVRRLLPEEGLLLPLNFSPEGGLLRALAELPPDSTVAVIGADERSRTRLEGLAHQYSLAKVVGTTTRDPTTVLRLVESADVVLTTNAAPLTAEQRARCRRLLVARFVLNEGIDLSRLAQMLAHPGVTDEGTDDPGPAARAQIG